MRPVVTPRIHRLAGAGILAVALIVSACTSAAPGWTFEPPPPATASPPPAASGALPGTSPVASAGAPSSAGPGTSAGASPVPSDASSPVASGTSSPGGSGAGGPVLAVKAENIAFDVTSLTAPANAPFQIKFQNEDPGTMHNVAIKDGSGALKWQGDLVTGVAETTYQVPALPAGSYTFICIVHPSMTGTLDIH